MSILIGKPQHASSFVFSPWENKPPLASTWLYVLDAEWLRNCVTKVTAITRTCQKSRKQVQLMWKYLWPRERTSHVFLWEKFIHWRVCMFMCVWVQSEARGQSRVSFLRCHLLCFVKQCLFLASNSPSRQGWLATEPWDLLYLPFSVLRRQMDITTSGSFLVWCTKTQTLVLGFACKLSTVEPLPQSIHFCCCCS